MIRGLVEQAQAGDRDAYERLATEVAPGLFRAAARILRDEDRAEDAVQQTLVAIWRDLPSLRDQDRFDAWTYRTLIRFCHSQTRRERRRGIRIVDVDDTMPSTTNALEGVLLRDQLRRAFDRLSLEHRTVVVLHHFVGLPLTEIAEILDVPYGTVGSRLHHAMRAMRAGLEADERTVVAGGQPA